MKKVGDELSFESVTRVGLEAAKIYLDAVQEISDLVTAAGSQFSLQGQSCCDIPPACWLPRCFGEFESRACPLGTALFRIRVTNCQPVRSTIKVAAKTDSDVAVEITPESVVLDPMERKWITIAAKIPADACKGEALELLVWVLGCNDHYARWYIKVADGESGSCVEATIEDCPDYQHHWYDHFYCARPCFSRAHNRSG